MSFDTALAHAAISLACNLTLLGSFLAAGAAVAFRFAPAAAPRARYLIAVAAFAAATLVPIAVTFSASRQTLVSHNLAPGSDGAVALVPTVAATNGPLAALASSGAETYQSAIAISTDRLDAFASALSKSRPGSLFIYVWAVVALLLLAKEAAGHVSLWWARQRWEPAGEALRRTLQCPRRVPLYVHRREGPIAVGLLHPAILIPADLLKTFDAEAAARILRHELSHAIWRDPLINALLRAARAMLWPSLPLWHLERTIRVEREAAADRAALHDLPSTSRLEIAADYAASVVQIARTRSQRAQAKGYARMGTHAGDCYALEERIRRLLSFSSGPSPARTVLAAMVLTVTVSLAPFVPSSAPPITQRIAADRAASVDRLPGMRSSCNRGSLALSRSGRTSETSTLSAGSSPTGSSAIRAPETAIGAPKSIALKHTYQGLNGRAKRRELAPPAAGGAELETGTQHEATAQPDEPAPYPLPRIWKYDDLVDLLSYGRGSRLAQFHLFSDPNEELLRLSVQQILFELQKEAGQQAGHRLRDFTTPINPCPRTVKRMIMVTPPPNGPGPDSQSGSFREHL
jgi:beta-lactamase regulating signal transducer with metallopeptidase domain